MNYYFQAKTKDLDWENTPSNKLTFSNDTEAYKYAEMLANKLKTEIRLTSDAKQSGTYIK